MKTAKGLFSFFFYKLKRETIFNFGWFSLPNMFLVNKNRKWSLKIKN